MRVCPKLVSSQTVVFGSLVYAEVDKEIWLLSGVVN